MQSVDVEMNDEKDAVSITVHVSEGEPIIVEDVRFEGLDLLPEWLARRLRRTAPLKAGEPLDRTAFAQTREAVVNAFRDRGYPYATVAAEEQPGSGGPRSGGRGVSRRRRARARRSGPSRLSATPASART